MTNNEGKETERKVIRRRGINYYPADENVAKLHNAAEQLKKEFACRLDFGWHGPRRNTYGDITLECVKPEVRLFLRPSSVGKVIGHDQAGEVFTEGREEPMSGKFFDIITVKAEEAGLNLKGLPFYEYWIEGKAKDEVEAVNKAREILQLLRNLKLRWRVYD